MPPVLPKPIAAYFAADAGNGAAVADCFTANAIVVDEQQTYQGRDAIAAWRSEAVAKYQYTSEPIMVEKVEDRTIVTAHLVGNFPGSPVDLRYAFTLADGAIARLEIVP
ncbi:MAG: polyketide cyclase [Sphingomonas sp. 66-10]|uniref:nuclear transport factor 2 family protein n=1 Tax=Sphingomonas sp. 66-10 TaxID=1895848 RepID=UPI00092B2A8F|nr:nuclear transport factor 2 family protein [Sphingomonas sp. 66-10]OJU22135.1 MAG: polyketide cyclase [Sphingomonas sp. 66-10]